LNQPVIITSGIMDNPSCSSKTMVLAHNIIQEGPIMTDQQKGPPGIRREALPTVPGFPYPRSLVGSSSTRTLAGRVKSLASIRRFFLPGKDFTGSGFFPVKKRKS